MDTVVLDFLATLFLATSIEALVVSLLVYFRVIDLDINFEQEVIELRSYQSLTASNRSMSCENITRNLTNLALK